ncbi:MAG: helix-turn-helix domain-containing protein [Candidatus Sulfotelmatobacter sp.]
MPDNSKPAPRLLNVQDAAAYLGTTVWFIRTLGWSDAIPIIRLGNRWLFDKADLDAYVDRVKVGVE